MIAICVFFCTLQYSLDQNFFFQDSVPMVVYMICLLQPRSPPSTPKTLEDKKSRSIEEREHDYEKARARIFQDVSCIV